MFIATSVEDVMCVELCVNHKVDRMDYNRQIAKSYTITWTFLTFCDSSGVEDALVWTPLSSWFHGTECVAPMITDFRNAGVNGTGFKVDVCYGFNKDIDYVRSAWVNPWFAVSIATCQPWHRHLFLL